MQAIIFCANIFTKNSLSFGGFKYEKFFSFSGFDTIGSVRFKR